MQKHIVLYLQSNAKTDNGLPQENTMYTWVLPCTYGIQKGVIAIPSLNPTYFVSRIPTQPPSPQYPHFITDKNNS